MTARRQGDSPMALDDIAAQAHSVDGASSDDDGPSTVVRTWVVERLSLPLAVGAGGYALVSLGAGDGSAAFRSTPQFEIWVLFVAAQFACWTAGYFFLMKWYRSVRDVTAEALGKPEPFGRTPAWTALGVLALLLGSLWVSYMRSDFLVSPLDGHRWRISAQILFGVLAVAPGLGALALLGRVGHGVGRAGRASGHARLLLDARRLVDNIVVLLGALIALTVLSTSALQAAMEARLGTENGFLTEYVLITGLLLSVSLGVFVLFATAGMGTWAEHIVNSAEPELDVTHRRWRESHQRRAELERFLTTKRDDKFSQSVAILAPFISATGAVAL